MEWPRVKNLILLLLLLINGFLLALVGTQQYEVVHYQRSALTRAVEVLEQRGISVEVGQLEKAPVPLTVERPSSPAHWMELLLGSPLHHTDQGGGVHLYSGPTGTAIYRSGGGLTAELFDGAATGESPHLHAQALLERLGLEAELWKEEALEDGVRLTFRQRWEGVPIFSCDLALVYNGTGQLMTLDGTLLPVLSAQPAASSTLDLSTALIRFWSGIVASGDVCSSLIGFRPGYRLDRSLGSEFSLSPVWYVSTNTADYQLDARTGALTRIS